MNIRIRKARNSDFDKIWEIFHPIVSAGDTYPYDPKINKTKARRIWLESPMATFVAEKNGIIIGTYYIKANQPSLGSHVCNCGYMVLRTARNEGVATAMCIHSQKIALKYGFKAMQFNLVVSTNKGAVKLWDKLGFKTIGKLPRAFNHAHRGYVDALVMYKWLK